VIIAPLDQIKPESQQELAPVRRPPLGQQVHPALIIKGPGVVIELARDGGQPDLFERVRAVADKEPIPSFLHSALCAMSLPVRRPADDQLAIIRQDGQYTLVITPKAIVQSVNGQQALAILGVPYGSLPRRVLIHIKTEAVRTKSRHVVPGSSFTDWMRKMGFRTISYGPRGSATLIRQQLDRLLACEWMIRWDNENAQGTKEFGIKVMKLTNEYVGHDSNGGSFQRAIFLTEGFFDHLRQHAVAFNEHAIRQLRDSVTALDLYPWLVYRLPRINSKRLSTLSWRQLAVHFGNEGTNIRKFRQAVRDAWERQVSTVYPEARADFDTTLIRLHASPAPLQRKLSPGAHLAVVPRLTARADDNGTTTPADPVDRFLGSCWSVAWSGRNAGRVSRREAGTAGWCLAIAGSDRVQGRRIRSRFQAALDYGREAIGAETIPDVIAKSR
jgi:hypothetical protein